MWRNRTSRQGCHVFNAAKRQLATKSDKSTPPLPIPATTPPRKSFGLVKFLGLTLPATCGGVVGYAWYDQDFRKQLETSVPYAKDILDGILPALTSPPMREIAPVNDVVPMPPPPPIFEPSKVDKEIKSLEKKPKEKTVEEPSVTPPAPSSSGNEHVSELENNLKADSVEQLKPDTEQNEVSMSSLSEETENPEDTLIDIAEAMKSKEEEDHAENAALEAQLNKLLDRSEIIIEETVKAQMNVVALTHTHVKLLKHAMDDTQEILNKDDQWKAVAVAYKEKENATFRSADLVSESKKSIENIQAVLALSKENEVTKANPAIFPATKKVVELTNAIGTANALVRQAESEARVMLKYKDLVDQGKKQFQQELESLMPEVKIGSTSKKLSEDELNALIAHAHRRIEQLQKQLAEQMSMERQRLTQALELQKSEDVENTLATVADQQLRLQNEFEAEKHKMELDFLVRQEEEIRKQLGRQAAAHSDHIKDVLCVQREQLSVEYNRQLNAKILEEREQFQIEIAGWISRLKGIETAVDSRAQSEHLARCAQDLWLACIALQSVIQYGIDDDSESHIPIQKEIDSILKVGNKHPFVETVVNSLPKAALEQGVYTEEQLRNRFVKVSRVCRRLGLITESNASLLQYLASLLHSITVFDRVVALTPSDQVDLNSLDNYGLVAHAQHFMSQGDLESAVRFMCQLKGQASIAASDWIKEAKILLETRQVASSLTAYASASGLANTF